MGAARHGVNRLLLHVFDLVDESDWINLVKHHYEPLLLEILNERPHSWRRASGRADHARLAMAFAVWRILRGPRAQDRVLGLDTLYVNALLMMVTFGIRSGSTLYFERRW